MEALKRQIRYQFEDSKRAFRIFWAILLSLNILFYFLNTRTKNGGFGTNMIVSKVDSYGNMITTVYSNVTSINIIPIAIFIIVYCIVMYYESFPTVIGFSATRKDFYLGVIISNAILCFTMAVIEAILLKLDKYIIRALGKEPYNTFLMFNLDKDNVVYVIAVLFLIFVLICSVFNFLGVVLYKIGYKFWIGFGIIFLIAGNIQTDKPILKSAVDFLFGYSGLAAFFIKVFAEALILYGAGWIFIRSRSIRSGK